MRFLCLAYYDEKTFETLSEAELAAIGEKCRPHDAALQQTGRVIEVGSLGPSRASVSLRPRKGRPTITDGPFAETKEQLGSYFLIEARDMEEAVAVASKHPAAILHEHLGWGIEIRPIEMCRVKQAAARSIPGRTSGSASSIGSMNDMASVEPGASAALQTAQREVDRA